MEVVTLVQEFELKLSSMGYNEEEIKRAWEELKRIVEVTAEALQDLMERMIKSFQRITDYLFDSLGDFIELVEDVLDEINPSTKWMKKSKRLEYVNYNRFVDRVIKRYYNRDIRITQKWFTRCCRKY